MAQMECQWRECACWLGCAAYDLFWVQMPIDVMKRCSIDASDDWRHGYADFCNTSRPNASALGPVYGNAGPAEVVPSVKCVLTHHANVRRVVTEVVPMTPGEDENGHAFAGPFQRHSAGQRRRDRRLARRATRLRAAAGEAGLRRGASHLERHDRSPTRHDRPSTGSRGCDPGGQLRSRARRGFGRAGRRSQRRG